MIWYGPKSEKV